MLWQNIMQTDLSETEPDHVSVNVMLLSFMLTVLFWMKFSSGSLIMLVSSWVKQICFGFILIFISFA